MAQEQQSAKVARESAENGQAESAEWFSRVGVPMVKIRASVSELIPTVQYGNVLIGPVSVERFVPDDENLPSAMQETLKLVEAATAEERLTTQVLLRANASAAGK